MLHSRKLQYIDEIARCGSIRKAAAHLNVASSAINRQILALEEELGVPIFERLPRGKRSHLVGAVAELGRAVEILLHGRSRLLLRRRSHSARRHQRGAEKKSSPHRDPPVLFCDYVADRGKSPEGL